MATDFLIDRNDIRRTRFAESETPTLEQPDQALLAIDHFALTANNVTYAVTGDRLGYWQFFPSAEQQWGKLPVWGYADVIASTHAALPVGERVYGFLPLASHLVVEVQNLNSGRFEDGAAHRQALNAIYNTYSRVRRAEARDEQLAALLRPMFTTAFLLEDYVRDSGYFGAQTLILSSASSKTAFATADLHRRSGDDRVTLIGLTSPRNVPFVQQLGCYDQVLPYAEAAALDGTRAAVYVDFSGNAELRRELHRLFGERLQRDLVVGVTDWERRSGGSDFSAVRPEMFFAPAQAQKRRQAWGGAEMGRRVNTAFATFAAFAAAQIDVVSGSGREAVQQTYERLVAGDVSPREGLSLTL